MTTYLVFGGDKHFHYLHGQVQIDGRTFQIFSDIEKAEEYKQDLLNGTNNSGMWEDSIENTGPYDHAEIRTFNLETK